MTERCALDRVRRKTGDTWGKRALPHGPQGLEERSRRPHPSPRHMPDDVVAAILDARPRPPSWGAKTLVALLSPRQPRWPWPARSPVWDSLRRHGLGPKKRQRRALGPPGTPVSHIGAPHEVWSADCTGPVKTGDGRSGYPLTSTEGSRRFLRRCQALASTSGAAANPVFTRVFNAFDLPQCLRTDHGGPFAPHPLARWSQLSAWWVRLGIVPECIEPGTPPPHGRHERRHRPLPAETTRPPGAPLRAQPRQFHRCRDECNHERPHEALDRRPPAACADPSSRKRPTKRPPLASPDRFEVRDVRATGGLRWHQQGGHVSHVCVGAYGGLEELDAGGWHVSFGPLKRGRRLARHRRIEEA
jgi:hypothetical protein